jgi:hypothetical protein
MISFLIVLIRVTNMTFRLRHLPLHNFTRSPILNKRIYVSIKPAIFESDPADPNVNRNPENRNALKIQENHLEDRKNYNNHKSEYNDSNLIGGIAQSG